MSILARPVLVISQFANRRGVYLGKRSTRWHVAVYRWSRGRIGSRMPGYPDARMLLLDHVGAKSGIHRTSPVIVHQAGQITAIAASKAGQPELPAWYHNLRAHPDTTIQLGPDRREVHARIATDTERARLWPGFVAIFPAFELYQRAIGSRPIPVIILEPR
jgi:deazaflavin-dependent oxidoreductase (nitroreductase family)